MPLETMQKPVQSFIKASDAASWVSCKRRAWLDKQPGTPAAIDPFIQLLGQAGLQHEVAVLSKLENQCPAHRATSIEHTSLLMQQKIPLIYQAQLFDEQNGLIGYPDFLILHPNGQYQPADAKLATSENKKAIQIQLGVYRRLLATSLPALVFLGDGRAVELHDDLNACVDEFVAGMKELIENQQQPAARYSHSKCRTCPYQAHCSQEFESKQDISLLYGIHGSVADQLADIGIVSIPQLAQSQAESLPDIPHLKGYKKKLRAILQAQSILSDQVTQLSPIVLPKGTWIHFDIEDNPLTPSRMRHVYLWGLLPPPHQEDNFTYSWTDDESNDYEGWIGFLNLLETYRTNYPDLILAHYSNHEKATIQKYAERYAMTQHAIVKWLLGEKSPLFDLQKPILESLVLPLQGYGLKDICKHPNLVNFQWKNAESGSQWSVVQFNRLQTESDETEKQKIRDALLGYNRDDVIATHKLTLWLQQWVS